MNINTATESLRTVPSTIPNSSHSTTPATTLVSQVAATAIQTQAQPTFGMRSIVIINRTSSGLWVNGNMHGPAELSFDDRTKYEGELNAFQQPHGVGVMIHEDGAIYKGDFFEGRRQGWGSIILKDGSLSWGEWVNGYMNGQGNIFFIDGTTYKGAVKDNKPHGQGVMIFKDGTKFEGEFADGKKHGRVTVTYPDGATSVGNWNQDNPVE